MRVCIVSHSERKGGAELVLLETVEALTSKGVDCRVLLPARGELAEELATRGITFHVIPYGLWMAKTGTSSWARLKSLVRILATTIPVALKIKEWDCDVVYSNTATVCVGSLAAWLLRRPHLWHFQEFGHEDHRLRFLFGNRLPFRLMNSLSTGWIANSKAVAMKYSQRLDAAKGRVVYYSMHLGRPLSRLEQPFPKPAGAFRCIIVGTLFEGKGQVDAVHAMIELKKRGIPAELFIVGGGDAGYRQYLQDLVAKSSLEKQVFFTGHLGNPLPLLQSADVALVCSRAEAFGRVTVEAMLAAKPVIASQSGANEELIRAGFNGLLYAPTNVQELADKIASLYQNPALAQEMGRNGRKWAEVSFTQERYGDELLSALTSAAKGPNHSPAGSYRTRHGES